MHFRVRIPRKLGALLGLLAPQRRREKGSFSAIPESKSLQPKYALRCLRIARAPFQALKAHRFVSPGQPPGTRGPQSHRALKGPNAVIPIARGGRGTVRIPAPSGHEELRRSGCPGRGPGLANSRPVGAVTWRAGGGIRIEVIGLLRTPLWHEFAGAVVEERRSIPGAGRALSAPNPLSGAFLVLDTFEGSGR